MGMFDWVNFEMHCPKCGRLVNDFQSKDFNCSLITIDPTMITDMYSMCSCGHWIELARHFNKQEPSCRETPYTLKEVEELGFSIIQDKLTTF